MPGSPPYAPSNPGVLAGGVVAAARGDLAVAAGSRGTAMGIAPTCSGWYHRGPGVSGGRPARPVPALARNGRQ